MVYESCLCCRLRCVRLPSLPTASREGRGGAAGRRCHLKFTRQTPSWMSMLRESLLNSLFTSSIPPTSLTVRVTLLFFSRLSCRFHVCPPSFSLLFFFLTHDCTPAYLSVLLKCRVSTSSVKDERKVCEHACAKLCMSNRLICPKEPRVSRDALSPSLQHSPLQMRLSLLIYFQQKKNGGSLFF